MDYDGYVVGENGIRLKGVRNFRPRHIFECGQCFRWEKVSEERYLGVVRGRVLEVMPDGEDIFLKNVTEQDFQEVFEDYFDLKRDYTRVKAKLSEDPILRQSVEYGYGIRILNQEPFETLISFIISSNNGIPRIRGAVKRIAETYGDPILYEGKTYHAFPTPRQLREASEEDLYALGVGYRAKYIRDTTKAVDEAEWLRSEGARRELTAQEKEILKWNLDEIGELPHEMCYEALQCYSGVGPKVSDCIMLFSMKKNEAFPVDVWVKKAMSYFYKAPPMSLPKTRAFGLEKFGDLAGFAQQYLFYNARENRMKMEDAELNDEV